MKINYNGKTYIFELIYPMSFGEIPQIKTWRLVKIEDGYSGVENSEMWPYCTEIGAETPYFN